MLSFRLKALAVSALSLGVAGALSIPLVGALPATAATGTGASVASNCSTDGAGSASCTINDPAGIRRVRVVDTTTGEVLATVGGHCSDNITTNETVVVHNVPAGDSVRFVVIDCGDRPANSNAFDVSVGLSL
jgi:hypothetical protein